MIRMITLLRVDVGCCNLYWAAIEYISRDLKCVLCKGPESEWPDATSLI